MKCRDITRLLLLTADNYFDNYILYLDYPRYTLYSKGGIISNADQEKESGEKEKEVIPANKKHSNKTT
jgi:hypothetical protein